MRATRPRARAFTLLEVLIALLVATVLLTALMIPLAARVNQSRNEETRRLLDQAREALLGFAAVHGRLPCPASPGSLGRESFAAGAGAADGRCSHFHDGLLPGAALGLAPLDTEGFVRDAWLAPSNRLRYAVFGDAAVGGVDNPLTRAEGLRSATLAALGAAPEYLTICASRGGGSSPGCGSAANRLTRRAAFVVFSRGPNAALQGAPGPDEAANLDGDRMFVSREPSDDPANAFDDLVTWTSIHLLAARMVAAGRLP